MDFPRIRNFLLNIADKAPCDVSKLTCQIGHTIRMPAIAPNGRVLGPANIPQEALKRRLNGKTYSEIIVKPSLLSEEEKLLFLQLRELKLVYVQSRPERGSAESVAPNGHSSYSPRVLGLTIKGEEFLELSKDEKRLSKLLEHLASRSALTFSNLLRELKRPYETIQKNRG